MTIAGVLSICAVVAFVAWIDVQYTRYVAADSFDNDPNIAMIVEVDQVVSDVTWLGWPVFAKEHRGIDPGFYTNGPPPDQFVKYNVEIGLAANGNVVWRKIESIKETEQ
jgi:hypothetical protein